MLASVCCMAKQNKKKWCRIVEQATKAASFGTAMARRRQQQEQATHITLTQLCTDY